MNSGLIHVLRRPGARRRATLHHPPECLVQGDAKHALANDPRQAARHVKPVQLEDRRAVRATTK